MTLTHDSLPMYTLTALRQLAEGSTSGDLAMACALVTECPFLFGAQSLGADGQDYDASVFDFANSRVAVTHTGDGTL